MTTQMSLGTAAKSLFQRPCGRQDIFAVEKNSKHQNALIFFLMLNICLYQFFFYLFVLFYFVFFYSVHFLSFAQGLSYFLLFFFKASRLQINPACSCFK